MPTLQQQPTTSKCPVRRRSSLLSSVSAITSAIAHPTALVSKAARRASHYIADLTTPLPPPKSLIILGNTNLWHGGIYFGGYMVMLFHFALINLGIFDPKGIFGTGTTTVLSWFIGWWALHAYKMHGQDISKAGKEGGKPIKVERALRLEFLLLGCQVFALAVGAGAFSRYYYGFMSGSDTDLFQSLSLSYVKMNDHLLPEVLKQWWAMSVMSRFTGVAWWTCEISDVIAHQMPYILLLRLKFSTPSLKLISHEINPTLLLSTILVSPIQRYFWDLTTCGRVFCDDPYHGHLEFIDWKGQVFWQVTPGLLFGMWGLFVFRSWGGLHAEVKSRLINEEKCDGGLDFVKSLRKEDAKDDEKVVLVDENDGKHEYSVIKTLMFLFVWMLSQIAIAWYNGGELKTGF